MASSNYYCPSNEENDGGACAANDEGHCLELGCVWCPYAPGGPRPWCQDEIEDAKCEHNGEGWCLKLT